MPKDVLIIVDPNDIVIEVGEHRCFTSKQLGGYAKRCFNFHTITIEEYRSKGVELYSKYPL